MARGGKRAGAGRPSGSQNKATFERRSTIAEMAQQYDELALTTLAEIAGNRGASEAARVSAANALLDRGYGKAVQGVTHSAPGGGPIAHVISAKEIPDDELARIALGGSAGASAT